MIMDIKEFNDRLNSMPLWMMLLLIVMTVGVGAGVGYVVLDDTPSQPVQNAPADDEGRQYNASGGVVYFETKNLTEATRIAQDVDVSPLPEVKEERAALYNTEYPGQEKPVDMQLGVISGRPANTDTFFDSLKERLEDKETPAPTPNE